MTRPTTSAEVTAETITEAHLRCVVALAPIDIDLGDYASVRELVHFALAGQPSARRRCAEIWNSHMDPTP